MSDEIRATLNERGGNYGKLMDNCTIGEALMDIVRATPGWENFLPDQRTATFIIFQKLSRALSGNAQYDDNWRDIAGYAQLIVDRINGTGTYAPATDGLSHAGLGRIYVEPADCTDTTIAGAVQRCHDCRAKVGDAHKADCPTLRWKTAGDLGGSPRS